MKEYECVEVGHHRNIGKTIEESQRKSWRLHTYACAHAAVGKVVNHYLLFEKESDKKMSPSAKPLPLQQPQPPHVLRILESLLAV